MFMLLVAESMLTFTSCKKDSLVSVITHSPTEITATTALCGGEFTFTTDEIGPFTVGVCWSTSPKPTYNDQRVTYPHQQEPFVNNQANPWEWHQLRGGAEFHDRSSRCSQWLVLGERKRQSLFLKRQPSIPSLDQHLEICRTPMGFCRRHRPL